MTPTRKAMYDFFELPFHKRIEIAKDLNIFSVDDLGLTHIKATQKWGRRIIDDKLISKLNKSMGKEHRIDETPVKNRVSIWAEGYAVTGQAQGASLIGTYPATNLDDAVKQYMSTHDDVDWDRYGRGRHAIWACELFDNEQAARKAFG